MSSFAPMSLFIIEIVDAYCALTSLTKMYAYDFTFDFLVEPDVSKTSSDLATEGLMSLYKLSFFRKRTVIECEDALLIP